MKSAYLALLAGALALTGCVMQSAGPVKHDFQSIDRDASEFVQVNLDTGAGNLQVGSGTAKLMMADFAYNVDSWKPELHYSSGPSHGVLTVKQPAARNVNLGSQKYDWDLRFSRDVPLDFHVHFGAGEGRLDLGSLNLRSVEVDMGVGQLQVDLRGNPKRDYGVTVRGGVGELTIHLPQDVGVIADAKGGIGEIQARGMRHEGNQYVNDALATSKIKIKLDVSGGIGSIHLICD